MDLQFGDIQETALITLAIRASETSRPNARIRDPKAKEIIDALGEKIPQRSLITVIESGKKTWTVLSGDEF